MTDDEDFCRIANTIKTGITNQQIARLAGVHVKTVLAYKRKMARAKKRDQTLFAKQEERRPEDIATELSKMSDPRERREAMYGQAMLAFERRQAALRLRPELPRDLKSA